MKRQTFSWLLKTLFVACILLAFLSCGHKGNRTDTNVGAHRDAPASGGSRTAPTIPLADVLRDIDAAPVPKGVSAELWATLVSDLKKQLIARATGGRGADRAGKFLSTAPTGLANAVSDLVAVSNPAGTQATLTWTEKLAGDYNNDGVVDITDLQPLALYYMQHTDTGPDDAHKLVNGDADPEINIADLGAVANNYMAKVEGYQVWRGQYNGTSTNWEPTFRPNTANPSNTSCSADRTGSPPAATRPPFTYADDISALADKTTVRYKVVPFGDGVGGVESNEAAMPPPEGHVVSGTVYESSSGIAGVTLTLTPGGLSAISQPDGTYAMTGVVDGSYTITPSRVGYRFLPVTLDISVASADVSGQDFAAIPLTYAVTGTVTLSGGAPLQGVTMTLTPSGLSGISLADGTYTVTGAVNGDYSLVPSKLGYEFSPPGRPVTIYGADATGQDFAGAQSGLAASAWPKFRGGSRNTGLSPYIGAQTGNVKWTCNLGGLAMSSAAVASDGTIFVGGGGFDPKVHAVEPLGGGLKWEFLTGDDVFSSPAVGVSGTVYIGGQDGYFYALDPLDGSLIWKSPVGGRILDSSPTVAVDGTIFIGCEDNKVYAFNSLDGSLKWTCLTGGAVSSSPSLGADGTVYVGSGDKNVYAIDPSDGTVKWKSLTGDYVFSSPSVGDDGTIYAGSYDYAVYSLNPADGSVNWKHTTGSYVSSSPAIGADGTVYIGSYDNNVYALNPSDGSVRWVYSTGATVRGSPAIGADGTVYVGSYDKNVYALNPADGSVKWTHATGGAVYSSPAIGADGTVYVGCNDGKVYAFGP